jgi:hypothetical protein
MARRLRLEDKYLAVKVAVQQRVTPRHAWQELVKPAVAQDRVAPPDSVRWEIRVLEEYGFNARQLIDLTYQHGVPWVEDNVPNGEEWIRALGQIAAAQIEAALSPAWPKA